MLFIHNPYEMYVFCFFQGELYRRVVYLEYLSEHFENEVWFIQHANNVLLGVLEMLPINRFKVIMVQEEVSRQQFLTFCKRLRCFMWRTGQYRKITNFHHT